ncbi:MAG: DUF916 domain-containing protein [Actinomycetota bacterium]
MKRISAVVLCLLIFTPVPSWAQEKDPNYVTEPAVGSSTAPQGGYFVIETTPGSKVTQNVALRNDDAKPLTLELAGVDAITGHLGGASYNLSTEPRKVVGAWITFGRPSVTLAPGESALAPFDVNVPADATPGEHLGGISISLVGNSASPTPGKSTGTGASIALKTRRIIAVQVNTPGDATPKLTITGVQPAARPDGLYLEVSITHEGRGLTKGKGSIEVSGGFQKSFDLDTFVPATSIRYPIKWRTDAPSGKFTVHVEITYDTRVAVWDGTFSVGEEVKKQLKDRQPPPPKPPTPVWIPAVGGGLAGLMIPLVIWLAIARGRRKRRSVS